MLGRESQGISSEPVSGNPEKKKRATKKKVKKSISLTLRYWADLALSDIPDHDISVGLSVHLSYRVV